MGRPRFHLELIKAWQTRDGKESAQIQLTRNRKDLSILGHADLPDRRHQISARSFLDLDSDRGAFQTLVQDAFHGRRQIIFRMIFSHDVRISADAEAGTSGDLFRWEIMRDEQF